MKTVCFNNKRLISLPPPPPCCDLQVVDVSGPLGTLGCDVGQVTRQKQQVTRLHHPGEPCKRRGIHHQSCKVKQVQGHCTNLNFRYHNVAFYAQNSNKPIQAIMIVC